MSIKENIKIKKPLNQYQTYSSNQPDTTYWYVFFPQKKYVRLRKSFFMEKVPQFFCLCETKEWNKKNPKQG